MVMDMKKALSKDNNKWKKSRNPANSELYNSAHGMDTQIHTYRYNCQPWSVDTIQ